MNTFEADSEYLERPRRNPREHHLAMPNYLDYSVAALQKKSSARALAYLV